MRRHFDSLATGGLGHAVDILDAAQPSATDVAPDPEDPVWRAIAVAKPMTADRLETAMDQLRSQPSARDLDADELGLAVTDDQVHDICVLLEKGTNKHDAARMIGLSPAELTNALRIGKQSPSKHPTVEARRLRMKDYAERIAAAESNLASRLSGKAVELALGRLEFDEETGKMIEVKPADPAMLKFVLERKFSDEWGNKTNVKHTGTVNHSVDVNVQNRPAAFKLSDLTDEQFKQFETIVVARQQAALPAPDAEDTEFVEG